MSETSSSQLVKSADRTLRLLEHLAAKQHSLSLHTLHMELGIPKSSLHGLLRTLRERGWVETDNSGKLFRLGARALLVGISYVDADEVVAASREVLDELGEETGETIHLARLDAARPQAEVVYLATRQSKHHLRLYSRIGRRLPAHTTALGKALLAHRSQADLKELLSPPLQALTEHTITDVDALQGDLAATLARGYALDWEENTIGIGCVGCALLAKNPPQHALSISVPLARLDEERVEELARLLQDTVERLQSRLFR